MRPMVLFIAGSFSHHINDDVTFYIAMIICIFFILYHEPFMVEIQISGPFWLRNERQCCGLVDSD